MSSRSCGGGGGRGRLAALLVLVLGLPLPALAAPWLVISELHPDPPEGGALEFVEVLLRDPPRADLADFRLEGDVRYRFPRGAVLLPGEPVVVAADPAALKALFPGLSRVLGPWEGNLGDRAGVVALREPSGALACEVRYKASGRWPAAALGTGRTLSLRNSYLDPRDAGSWEASLEGGGTPGADNGLAQRPEPEESRPLIKAGDTWRFFRGNREPPASWMSLSLDDSSWESGPSGFGYADGDDATVLSDMEGQYLSLFTRKVFEVEDPSRLGRLTLRVDYDDGFSAWLNGEEVARANLLDLPGWPAGVPVSRETPAAAAHEAGFPSEIDLGPAASRLRPGKNVLAVQVHNSDLDSSDLSLTVELLSRELPGSSTEPGWSREDVEPLLNEVILDAEGSALTVEILNPAARPLDLSGWRLSDDPRDPDRLRVPPGTVLPPRGLLALGRRELGSELRPRGGEVFLALSPPRGPRLADAVRLEGLGGGGAGRSFGRPPGSSWRGGGGPFEPLHPATPGSPNLLEPPRRLVLNEVLYRPPPGEESLEFVELHNPGKEYLDLAGFRLRGGLDHDFPAGARLAGGGYLVVARDPGAVARRYGLPEGAVAGPARGRLSDSGETLTLLDPRGLRVDRVLYADRDPWPERADGSGSLERIHPDLDGALARSWAASAEGSKARWQEFRYSGEYRARAGLAEGLQFLLLGDGECLIDDLELRFGVDGEVVLHDALDEGLADWTATGTHEESGAARDRERGPCYAIRASGRGSTHQNGVLRATGGVLGSGRTYEVRFRARWQGGSPLLLTRTPGNSLARVHRLEVPGPRGTPGAANSARLEGPPPAVGTPAQRPAAPREGEKVEVRVPISAVGGLAAARLRWRRDGEEEFQEAPLDDRGRGPDERAGDGIYSGEIPPLETGLVEFLIEAEDRSGRRGSYPADAPARTALYAVGLRLPSKLPSLTLLVSEREWARLQPRPGLSNRFLDATLLQGDSRLIYNAGFRPRGSPFTRRRMGNWKVSFGAENLDGRRSLILDRQGGNAQPSERLTYWLLDALRAPTVRTRYVHFQIYGREDGVAEEVEEVDGGFIERWFGEDSGRGSGGGQLYKVDDHIELAGNSIRLRQPAALRDRGPDPEDYRWNFSPRGSAAGEDDLQPLIELVQLLDPARTADEELLARVEKTVHVDEWLRVLAARTMAGDWDTLGRHGGKNAFLYRAHTDGRFWLLPWDCDQAMASRYPPTDSIDPPRNHAAFVRLLEVPRYRRLYAGYLAYLAERKLAPGSLGPVLEDLRDDLRLPTEQARRFLEMRRSFVQTQVSDPSFRVLRAERLPREGGRPDLLRLEGEAPPLVQGFRLGGREPRVTLEGLTGWTIELPVGPEGGDLLLQGLDAAGEEAVEATVGLPPRRDAPPLPREL